MPASTSSASTAPKVIVFLQFPIFVLTWPLILMGWVLWLIAPAIGEQMTGIVWISTLFVVLISMGFDFDRFQTAIFFLAGALIIVVMMLITVQWKIPIFHQIVDFVGFLKLTINRDVMLALSCLLSIVYLLMMINAQLNHRWVVTMGKMECKKIWGHSDELPINPTQNVNYKFRDQLDRLLLFNGGHLAVKLPSGQTREIGLIWGSITTLDHEIDKFEQVVTNN